VLLRGEVRLSAKPPPPVPHSMTVLIRGPSWRRYSGLRLTRPAVRQSDEMPSIELAQPSPFQRALEQANQGRERRASVKLIARRFVSDAGFVGSPEALPVADELDAVAVAFGRLEAERET
jgi:hypothetical protein